MSVSAFSIGHASIAEAVPVGSSKKPPPKRTTAAMPDRKLAPEPR